MASLNLPNAFWILILATIAFAHDYHADGWRSASGFLRASMDPTKDPCRDFYGHACGRWVNRASREGSDELRDAETKLRDLLLTSLEKIELNSTTANYPNYQRWLRVFYDQCMDLSVMNETELLKAEYRALEHSFEYLFNVTLESSRANARYAVWLTAGYLEQHYLGHLLIETNIDWIMDNCTKRSVLKLSHPSNVDLRISRDQLVEYVKQLYELFGWPLEDEQTATDEADQVKELETKLNVLLDKQYDSLNGEDSAKGKLMRYSNLKQEYPGIDWEAYFTGLFPEGWHSRWNETDPLVLVVGDVYFKSIADVLKETRYQILQNYAYWKLIAQIREFYVKKTNEGISGLQTTKEKRSFCYGLLKEFSPAAVARMYFDALRTDPVEWRNDVDLLAHNILSAFRIFVSGQDWLDAQDKMAIVERINGIRIETGIPVWLANETEVNVRTPKFDPKLSTLENVVNSHRLAFMDKIRPLITSGGEAFVEKPPVFTTGARYIYGKIEVYMGQILPPLYHSNYPLAVKYGMLGWAMRIVFDYKWSLYGMNDPDHEILYFQTKKNVHQRSAERLLSLACSNGGVFIKVGQHCGALDYLLPDEYVKTLSVLHSRAPQSSLDDVMKVIEEELHKKPSELFETFEPKPLGAASLAQVHKAKLKDGRIVAVKVQHRRVKPNSFVDMTTMEFLTQCVSFLMPEFQLNWLVDEMKKNLPNELNFVYEGKHADRVRRMLAHLKFLKVPEIHWDLSTHRVLTMEFVEGGQVNDFEYIKRNKISPSEICKKLGQLYSEMIFIHGYVHCDPHPGNLLVYKHPTRGFQLALLDHGLYVTLDEDFRLNYAKLWLAILKADLPSIKQAAGVLGVGEFYGLFACMVTARSWQAVTGGIERAGDMNKKESEEIKQYVATYLPQISDVLNRVPRPMLLILKTNDLLRGIEYTLKTVKNAYSFLEMSRYCVAAVYDYAYNHCEGSWSCAIRVRVAKWLALGRITMYTWFLSFLDTLSNMRRQLLFREFSWGYDDDKL